MTLTIHNFEQRSPEWYAARCGIVTASAVGNLLTVRKLGAVDFDCPKCEAPANDPCLGQKGQPIKTLHPERAEYARAHTATVIEPASNENSRSYTELLVAERINGWVVETYTTDAMWRGVVDEPIARDVYSEHYTPAAETGFMVEDRWGFKIGYSPDGLVGSDGLLEIKSRAPKHQVKTAIAGVVPMEHMPQIQAGLLVSGRKWLDYISFAGGMHMWTKRVYTDPKWQNAIVAAVRKFEANAAEMIRLYTEAVEGMPLTERTVFELNPNVELEAS